MELAKTFADSLKQCQHTQKAVNLCTTDQECTQASLTLTLCMRKILCPIQHKAVVQSIQITTFLKSICLWILHPAIKVNNTHRLKAWREGSAMRINHGSAIRVKPDGVYSLSDPLACCSFVNCVDVERATNKIGVRIKINHYQLRKSYREDHLFISSGCSGPVQPITWSRGTGQNKVLCMFN
jgi:hypothetical protein